MTKKVTKKSVSLSRPPVVTVLGHVDHGKTTLLDFIRKTNVAGREFGGITQHIGAYQITTSPNNKITFIDTPGHEAFGEMRSRGAEVADVVVLVVAANDGVMPQTIESIQYIKNANLPCVVAINKIDMPDVNLEKIKKQLIKAGLTLEEYGGETPMIPLSAKTGQGVDKLIEMILLLAELHPPTVKDQNIFEAVVIETTLSRNRGIVATIIVRNGSLHVGDTVVCENQEFRVRAFNDWQGKSLSQIGSGDPTELLGWQKIPTVGSRLYDKKQASLEKQPARTITHEEKATALTSPSPQDLETEKVKLIIKADTQGTLEAIMHGLGSDAEIILRGVGQITESDVLLAKTTKAIIIGFHLQVPDQVTKLASSEKVFLKSYNIIYEMFDEIADVIEALKKGNLVTVFGEAQVIAVFNIKNEIIAGLKVVSGRIARGDQIKVVRNNTEIGRAKIKSLRHQKEDITKAEQGKEAGAILSQKIEILTGDSIIAIG